MSQKPAKPAPDRRQDISSEESTDDTTDTDSTGTDSTVSRPPSAASSGKRADPASQIRPRKVISPRRPAQRREEVSSDDTSDADTESSDDEPAPPPPKDSGPPKPSSPVRSTAPTTKPRPRQTQFRELLSDDMPEPDERDAPPPGSPARSVVGRSGTDTQRSTLPGRPSSSRLSTSRQRFLRRPTDPSDPEKGNYRKTTEESSGSDWCSCSSCDSCGQCWGGTSEWRVWSWLRRQSAFIVAFLAACGMTAAGLTAISDFWIFASVDGKDLGGFGYCEGGTCEISPLYDITTRSDSTDFLRSTQIISLILLLLSGVGGVALIFLAYLTFSAFFGQGTFQPLHKRLLWCSRFSLAGWEPHVNELRQACADNGIQKKWKDIDDLSGADKLAILNDSRRKTCFQMFMFWFFWPVGTVLAGLAWFWTDYAEADEKFGFEVTVWGGMAMMLSYLISVNIYRPTVEGATRRKLSHGYHKAGEEARLLKSQAAAAGRNIRKRAGRVGDKAGEMGGRAKDAFRQHVYGRKGPRRPGGKAV